MSGHSPSRCRSGKYTFEAYGQPQGTVVLTWYVNGIRSAMRDVLTVAETRAFISILENECNRVDPTVESLAVRCRELLGWKCPEGGEDELEAIDAEFQRLGLGRK